MIHSTPFFGDRKKGMAAFFSQFPTKMSSVCAAEAAVRQPGGFSSEVFKEPLKSQRNVKETVEKMEINWKFYFSISPAVNKHKFVSGKI